MANSEPAAIQRLKTSLKALGSAAAKKIGKEAALTEADVVLTGPRKNGNTWTQNIMHGLRSHGDLSFEEIGYAIPELELWSDYGDRPLTAEQKYKPQMYRTHLDYTEIPKGAGKYIVIVRDPHDVAVSLYHYWADWLFDPKEISVDELTEYLWLGHEDRTQNTIPCQMDHYADWYDYRFCDNVLWLHFEDLKQDLRGCVKLMAKFLELDWQDEKLIDLVTKQSDISFMKMHKEKFDAHQNKQTYNIAMGLDADAGKRVCRVRDGKSGIGKASLSERVVTLINKRWEAVVEKKTGFKTYAEMRASINEELGRSLATPTLKEL